MSSLTPRGKTLRHLSTHRGITEQPAGSNCDNRKWGIRRAQTNCAGGGSWLHGTPWCGEWCFWALQHGGVKGITSRLASVALIEDDARANRLPFLDWRAPSEWKRVMRGDLVVLFGRGVHVETVRSFRKINGSVFVVTDGGNTSSGSQGSQSNGGGSFRRVRPLSDVHGFARVNYPGGVVHRMADRLAMKASSMSVPTEDDGPRRDPLSDASDPLLAKVLNRRNAKPEARALAEDLKEASA